MAISADSAMLALAHKSLDDGKAKDLITLHVADKTPVTDHMLVCCGTSQRHVKALAENLIKAVKDSGEQPLGVEGLDDGEWVLVDLGDVVVHVMQPQTRAFYQLEKLWSVGPGEDDSQGD